MDNFESRVVTEVYNTLNRTSLRNPETFNADVLGFHTKRFIEKILGFKISKDDYVAIYKALEYLWCKKYQNTQLWCYCCGSLIFKPLYASNGTDILALFSEEVEILEKYCKRRCVS